MNFWLIRSADVEVFDLSASDNQSESSDSTLCPQTSEISKNYRRSMDGGVNSKIRLPISQIVACEHPERRNPEILKTLSTQERSAKLSSDRPTKIPRKRSEEHRHDDGRDNSDRGNHELAVEVSVSAPSIPQARALSTPGVVLPSTPVPSSKGTKRFAVENLGRDSLLSPSRTPISGFHLADWPSSSREIQSSADKSYLASGPFSDVIETMLKDDDGLKDIDVRSIRDRMLSILETMNTLAESGRLSNGNSTSVQNCQLFC